jgi:ubiquinone/menaquinone biosynthesis C-methylase UbiE
VQTFPHWLSFVIDNPLRSPLISPSALAARLRVRPADRVLEVGPGSGFFSVELARRLTEGRLHLFDLQREMLAKARRKLRAAGLANVAFAQGDAAALPYTDGVFDIALLVTVLGEVPDRRGCLRSLGRVLRPGGLLVIHEQWPDPDLIAIDVLRAAVEREGFRFEESLGPRWNYTAVFRNPEASSGAATRA